MTTTDWASSTEFAMLCDLVASDHLVCMTGAGISRGLLRETPSPAGDDRLPSWIELLRELLEQFQGGMTPDGATYAWELLDPVDERAAAYNLRSILERESDLPKKAEALGQLQQLGPIIGSRELILAASLIRAAQPEEFDKRFRAAVTEAPGQFSDTHRSILALNPRGIMTFNYDGGHEASCIDIKQEYVLLNPVSNGSSERLRDAIAGRLSDFFILKAHGSTDTTDPLVLTISEYNNLLGRSPAYRAFVQNLFTNFSFIMVGYGLDDPDFDVFLSTMAVQFAGPLQSHIVLRPATQRHRRQLVERELYGIHTLYINDYGEIPDVLDRSARTAGPKLIRTIQGCLDRNHAVRVAAHGELRRLGLPGRSVAGYELAERLEDADSFVVAEAAYSLGILDAEGHKERLCQLVDASSNADVLGRAITVLRSALTRDDLPRVQDWLERVRATPPSGERAERIETYLEYLLEYVYHKFESDPDHVALES